MYIPTLNNPNSQRNHLTKGFAHLLDGSYMMQHPSLGEAYNFNGITFFCENGSRI